MVNNLTDARYFSAMGVDYIGFCCNPGTESYCSIDKIKEITDWVEGPKFVLEFSGWQEESEIQNLLDSGLGNAVHFGAFSDYKKTFSVPVFKDYIFENIIDADLNICDYPVIRSERTFFDLSDKEKSDLKEVLKMKPCFLDFQLKGNEIETILSEVPIYGIILRGGEEEKVGVKSFEDLDEIFESLSN
jgi:phosphoribosylanthranilate isomerase